MRFHSIHHVSFEGLGTIAEWADKRGYKRSATWHHMGDTLPSLGDIDILVIMGGPMSINDEEDFPWLSLEKALIHEVIDAGKPVLGICLGAQLIADALDAKVAPNSEKEIGWYALLPRQESIAHPMSQIIPEGTRVLHWHGDRFAIPEGSTPLWQSEACDNQGFVHGNALALQFHLEMLPGNLSALCAASEEELAAGGQWVSDQRSLMGPEANYAAGHIYMERLLDLWLPA